MVPNELYDIFSKELDETWQGMRWILDALHYARDRQIRGGIPLVEVFEYSVSHPDGQCCVCSSDLKGKVLCNGHSEWKSFSACICWVQVLDICKRPYKTSTVTNTNKRLQIQKEPVVNYRRPRSRYQTKHSGLWMVYTLILWFVFRQALHPTIVLERVWSKFTLQERPVYRLEPQ